MLKKELVILLTHVFGHGEANLLFILDAKINIPLNSEELSTSYRQFWVDLQIGIPGKSSDG